VKEDGGHLVNQPLLKLIDKWKKTIVGSEISTVRKQTNKQSNKQRKRGGKITEAKNMPMCSSG